MKMPDFISNANVAISSRGKECLIQIKTEMEGKRSEAARQAHNAAFLLLFSHCVTRIFTRPFGHACLPGHARPSAHSTFRDVVENSPLPSLSVSFHKSALEFKAATLGRREGSGLEQRTDDGARGIDMLPFFHAAQSERNRKSIIAGSELANGRQTGKLCQ